MNEKYPYFALKKYTCNTNCLKGGETYRSIEDGNITFSLVKKKNMNRDYNTGVTCALLVFSDFSHVIKRHCLRRINEKL